MEPSTSAEVMEAMESHLVASVHENLNLCLTSNASFLCERLVAQFPSEANLYLLATCYHRGGQTFRAYQLLRGPCVIYSVPVCVCPKHVRRLNVVHAKLLQDLRMKPVDTCLPYVASSWAS